MASINSTNHGHATIAAKNLIKGAVYLNQGFLFLLLRKQTKSTGMVELTWINMSRNKIVGPEDWYPQALLRVELVSEPEDFPCEQGKTC